MESKMQFLSTLLLWRKIDRYWEPKGRRTVSFYVR
jgi:hypothetical protein